LKLLTVAFVNAAWIVLGVVLLGVLVPIAAGMEAWARKGRRWYVFWGTIAREARDHGDAVSVIFYATANGVPFWRSRRVP
jgi:hypothetical protein